MRRRLRAPLLVAVGIGVIALLTIGFYSIVMDIETDFLTLGRPDPIDSSAFSKPLVNIGVVSRYPPTIMYRGYQPIMDYLTATTPYRFELLLGKDYSEGVHHLLSRRAAAVFMGSYLYVSAHEKYGIIPILKPLNENHQPFSRSVLFVRGNSPIRSVNDLKGKKIALPSAESFSANWYIELHSRIDAASTQDHGDVQNFSHHHTVIAQVLNGRYDAGVTRELLLKDLLGKELRAVSYSDPIPSSPIAALKDHPSEIIQAMTEALLLVNRNDSLRSVITREWDAEFVNGFVRASDEDYDVIRALSTADRRRGGSQ